MTNQCIVDWLDEHHACPEARLWVRERGIVSLDEMWARCPSGSWMLWLLGYMVGEPGWPSLRQIARVMVPIYDVAELMTLSPLGSSLGKPAKSLFLVQSALTEWANGGSDIHLVGMSNLVTENCIDLEWSERCGDRQGVLLLEIFDSFRQLFRAIPDSVGWRIDRAAAIGNAIPYFEPDDIIDKKAAGIILSRITPGPAPWR